MIQTNHCSTDKQNLEEKNGEIGNKIPDVSGLVTTAVLNTKIGEVENNIPDVSGLVITAVLIRKTSKVDNKIPDVSSLVKKTDYGGKNIEN